MRAAHLRWAVVVLAAASGCGDRGEPGTQINGGQGPWDAWGDATVGDTSVGATGDAASESDSGPGPADSAAPPCAPTGACTRAVRVDGVCTDIPLDGPCQDGDPCTTDDWCHNGACTGTPTICASCEQCDGAGGCVLSPGFCKIDSLCIDSGAHPLGA